MCMVSAEAEDNNHTSGQVALSGGERLQDLVMQADGVAAMI